MSGMPEEKWRIGYVLLKELAPGSQPSMITKLFKAIEVKLTGAGVKKEDIIEPSKKVPGSEVLVCIKLEKVIANYPTLKDDENLKEWIAIARQYFEGQADSITRILESADPLTEAEAWAKNLKKEIGFSKKYMGILLNRCRTLAEAKHRVDLNSLIALLDQKADGMDETHAGDLLSLAQEMVSAYDIDMNSLVQLLKRKVVHVDESHVGQLLTVALISKRRVDVNEVIDLLLQKATIVDPTGVGQLLKLALENKATVDVNNLIAVLAKRALDLQRFHVAQLMELLMTSKIEVEADSRNTLGALLASKTKGGKRIAPLTRGQRGYLMRIGITLEDLE